MVARSPDVTASCSSDRECGSQRSPASRTRTAASAEAGSLRRLPRRHLRLSQQASLQVPRGLHAVQPRRAGRRH